jgi:hypothetical protein
MLHESLKFHTKFRYVRQMFWSSNPNVNSSRLDPKRCTESLFIQRLIGWYLSIGGFFLNCLLFTVDSFGSDGSAPCNKTWPSNLSPQFTSSIATKEGYKYALEDYKPSKSSFYLGLLHFGSRVMLVQVGFIKVPKCHTVDRGNFLWHAISISGYI